MRADVVACDNCERNENRSIEPGSVEKGWLSLIVASARLGQEDGFVNLVARPVVVDLCSPACAQAWATKLFETIFGKVEGKEETPVTEPITVEATTPPEA